ncbi:MvdC/MvdD family ATP grasp protein [Salinarimonas chemoclinalis]|uniref:MvdC/MvdD family ATP grasp protein n=1 Tax=Salinarimonas chemoclinalis TaxID=3241599 RepID=UPI003556E021
MILVVSTLHEPSVNRVVRHLEDRGAPWARINTEEFPLLRAGRIALGGAEPHGVLDTPRGAVDTRAVTAVWMRRASRPAVPRRFSAKDKAFVADEANAFLNGFLDLVSGRFVNPREAERRARKIPQLELARRCGLSVPRTLVTNDADAVRAFAAAACGPVVFKPLAGVGSNGHDFARDLGDRFGEAVEVEPQSPSADPDAPAELVFSQILTPERAAHLDALRYAPAIFQDYVEKAFDVRVTYVAGRVFACRIHSQEADDTAVDFRRMALRERIEDVGHALFEPPVPLREGIERFMQAAGLVFGCLDFVETPDGAFVFLEVNPSGQWLWVEQLTGAPISEAVADALCS